jgi:hypothetical protein
LPAAEIDYSVASGDAVLSEEIDINTSKVYSVEALIVPWAGSFAGNYRLYLRLDDVPDITQNGVIIELVANDSTGSYSGTVTSIFNGGAPTVQTLTGGSLGTSIPAWLSATVDGDAITVYWDGISIFSGTVDSQTGFNVGFGMDCTVAGLLALVNVFRVQYFSTGTVNQLRSMLIASAEGNLFYESTYGRLTQVSTALTLNDGVQLTATQDGQKLYIADFGDVVSKNITGAVNGTVSTGSVNGTALTDANVSDWTTLGILPDDMVVVVSNPLGTAVAGTYKINTVSAGSVTLSSSASTNASSVSYRIERAPKIYDPLLNTLSILTATTGQVPSGCPLICRYLDRIVLAGQEIAPHVWYMARVSTPTDWDYSQSALGDVSSAVAGTASAAGVPGEAITALVAHSDDYLIIGCRNSLWKMIGDPANGGVLVNLSHAIGIVGAKAWCLMPDGSMLFLSMDGLYALDAVGDAYPVSVSRETLPKEFDNFDPDKDTVSMEYDIKAGGVHIFITPIFSDESLHFFLDTGIDTSKSYGVVSTTARRTFWPFTLISDHEPTATCTLQSTTIEDSGVILGGRDGFLRKFSDLADTDCGSTFDSYVVIGPIALNSDNKTGTVLSMDAVFASVSGDVDWSLSPSPTFEGSVTAATSDQGTWTAGLNATVYPACSGQAFTLTVSGDGLKWAMEQVSTVIKTGGRRRLS